VGLIDAEIASAGAGACVGCRSGGRVHCRAKSPHTTPQGLRGLRPERVLNSIRRTRLSSSLCSLAPIRVACDKTLKRETETESRRAERKRTFLR